MTEKYLDQQQWLEKQEFEGKSEVKEQSFDKYFFEIGQIDASNQSEVTEDVEIREIVEVDEKIFVLSLQNQTGS